MPGGSEVLPYYSQPVQAQYDHQEVLDGEENQHLVDDFEDGHDGEPDQQKRPVLDEQGVHDAPHVRAVSSQEGGLLGALLTVAACPRGDHFSKIKRPKHKMFVAEDKRGRVREVVKMCHREQRESIMLNASYLYKRFTAIFDWTGLHFLNNWFLLERKPITGLTIP